MKWFLILLVVVSGILSLSTDSSWDARQDDNTVFAAEKAPAPGGLKEKAKFTTIMEKYGLALAIVPVIYTVAVR